MWHLQTAHLFTCVIWLGPMLAHQQRRQEDVQPRPYDSSGLSLFWDTMLVFSASPPRVCFFSVSQENV